MGRTAFGKKQKKFFMELKNKNMLLKKLAGIIDSHTAISFAYIYGSFLGDNAFGDIDTAIYLNENHVQSKEQVIRQELDLEMTLQEKFGYPFDVRAINYAPLSFRYNVLKNGRMLCSKDEELRVNFVTRTIDNYIDFLPYRKRYLKEVLGLEI